MSDVEEKVFHKIYDEGKKQDVINVVKKNYGLTFVRGDLVMLVNTPSRN